MERYCTKCGKIAIQKNDSLYMCEAGHENWVNPALGACIYIIKDGKVLFGVRSADPGKGMLDVPGGFVEVHESAEQAAVRETKEELGIDVTLGSCFGTYPSMYEGRPALNIVFLASMPPGQKITPSDDMAGGEPVWRGMEDLPGSGEVMDDWMLATHTDLLAWWRKSRP
ncbi:MAG TPA: NUDIX domain-containing protein [Candidatus Saccharimonadales bacterium]|nr:NUDIX domain-containing protein [Candidatus Saccharimonadales bacterium]